jgi:hypothetical protein
LPIIEGSSSAFELFQDIGSLGSPDEWFGLVVVFIDVGLDCYDEFFYIAEDTAPQPRASSPRHTRFQDCLMRLSHILRKHTGIESQPSRFLDVRPELDSLHSDPRFLGLLRQMKLSR